MPTFGTRLERILAYPGIVVHPTLDNSSPDPLTQEVCACFLITHQRGPVSRQVRTAAIAWGGEKAWEELLDTVTPECRSRFLKPIGFYEWVETTLAVELSEAWVRRRGIEDTLQRGEDTAREILGGVQQWILRLASPGLLLQNVPRLFAFYHRGGQVKVVHLEAGVANLAFRGTGYPEAWFRDGLSAWLKVAMEMTGARDVRINYLAPDSEAEPYLHHYEVFWQR